MNSKNKESAIFRARKAVLATKAKAYGVGGALMSAAPFAFAQDAFDPSAVTTMIVTNTALAVTVVGAMILGGWTLRSMGLLRGRS